MRNIFVFLHVHRDFCITTYIVLCSRHCRSDYEWLKTEKIVLTVKERLELSAKLKKGE
jgi:hypothetical protein